MGLVFHSGFETGDLSEWPIIVGSPEVVDRVLFENFTITETTTPSLIYGTHWSGQTFTPDTEHEIFSVELWLKAQGSPSGTLTVSIRATSGYHPTGGDLASGSIPASSIGSTYSWVKIALSTTCTLSAGTKYAIVVGGVIGDTGDCVHWLTQITKGYKLPCNAEWSENSGDTWASNRQYDRGFKEYGSIKHTGDYAMRCNTSVEKAYATATTLEAPHASFYLRIASAPSADTIITGVRDHCAWIELTSDRYLKLYDPVGLIGTSSTQLQLHTWYRIEFSGTVGLGGTVKVFITGTEEISGNVDSSVYAELYETNIGVIDAVIADLYFDDYIKADLMPPAVIGDVRVLRASPNADGINTDFNTREPTNSRPYFGLVNECPADDANYVSNEEDAGVDKEETYDLQECSGLGIGASDTIEAVSVWCRMDKGTGKASTHQLVVYDEENYEYTMTFSKTYGWKNKYLADRPGGGTWSQDVFDAFEAGAGNAGDGGQDTFLSCVMAMVAYIPVAAPPPVYIPRHSGTVGVLMI